MKTIPGPLAVLMLPVLLMTGCGGYVTMKREVSDIQGKTEQKVEQMQTEILQGGVESPLVKHVKTVWIGASPVPYERGSSLPPQFDEVTINFGGRHNIASVGEIIQRTTGLKVIIHPDVLVPMSKLATVSGGALSVVWDLLLRLPVWGGQEQHPYNFVLIQTTQICHVPRHQESLRRILQRQRKSWAATIS